MFQRFYGLREGLIERFYAARSPIYDKARVLWGEPPVPIPAAILAMFNRGPPLKSEAKGDPSDAIRTDLQPETKA